MMSATEKYTTEDGTEILLKAVRPVQIDIAQRKIEQEWRDRGRVIDPPQFKIEFERKIGTAEIWADHRYDPTKGIDTLTVPDDPRQTAINHALWQQYESDRAELEEELTEAQFRLFVTFGIECEMPDDDQWERELALIGVDTAEDSDERRFNYLWFYLLSPFDKYEVAARIQFLSQGRLATEDRRRSFRGSLRSAMERAVGTELDRIVDGFQQYAQDGTGEIAERLGELRNEGPESEGLDGQLPPP